VKKLLLSALAFVALIALAVAPASAQTPDITGNWQGTLAVGKGLRIIMVFAKDGSKLTATMYSIDQTPQPIKASSASIDGNTVKFAINLIGATYEGKLNADTQTIDGTYNQGGPIAFTLVRPTKDAAWEIPAPPPPPKLMAADADPSFDVATIKPNNSGGQTLQGLNVNGRNFSTKNSSLSDIITFAYNVHSKQLVGLPDWATTYRFDIAAVPDVEGDPSVDQLKVMLRKLIVERFGLKYHHDKKELSAFVLTVGKTGTKLTATQITGSLPGLGMHKAPGGLMLNVINGTMGDFTGFLQTLVLDRPVVDQTSLAGKFDFNVTFTPDDSMFNGHNPIPKANNDDAEPAPTLFDALLQTTGLKLSAEKTQVDVMVIDHAEKPSAN